MRTRLILLCLLAAAALPALSGAATPPSQDVPVPASGDATVTWTGTIPTSSNLTGICVQGTDEEELEFTVPANLYDTKVVEAEFSITWEPSSPDEITSDEILEVTDPDGNTGSSDGSDTTETVIINNPKAGTYTVTACGYNNLAAQDYQGKLRQRTSDADAGGEPSLPSADAQGLSFTASVPADPQRDEAEPIVEIDRDGNIYTCGPTGFSNASDYAQVSTDGGDQFHLLGEPPRGQQGSGGGGDCALATGAARNAENQFTYAYTGLGPLTGFTTSTSEDSGHTLATGGPQGNGNTAKGGLADRQWMTFLDETTVLLSYNQQRPRNIVVQKSTDGGLTYNDASPDPDQQGAIAANDPDFPGPIRSMPASLLTPGAEGRVAYFGWNQSVTEGDDDFLLVNFAISDPTGLSWKNCLVRKLPVDDFTGLGAFTIADNDRDGNIYLTYSDEKRFHTYLTTLRRENLSQCDEQPQTDPATSMLDPLHPSKDPGWSAPVQVDRDSVRTTVFPWLVASGEPGRVAVSFYGTESDGDPNSGAFKASWDVYVNQSLNALDADPAVSQVKATTHPFHYDSVCLLGLGCDVAQPPGDRSLADFFAIGYSETTKRLSLVYDQSSKVPDAAAGVIATPAVVVQNGGPSNGGGDPVARIRPVLNETLADPAGDALANYSSLNPPGAVNPPNTQPEPAADILSETVSRQRDPETLALVDNGGFDVTLQLADLSDAALAKALSDSGSGSLLYTFRFVNGYQAAAASAYYSQSEGWSFGFNDYTVASAQCGSSGDKCQVFPGNKELEGKVDVAKGTIVLSVPRDYLSALTGPTGDGQRPTLSSAIEGSRFYDATTFTLANPSPAARTMSFVYPLDNPPATDFLLPGATTDAAGDPQTETADPATIPGPGAVTPGATPSATPTASPAADFAPPRRCTARRILRRARVVPRRGGRARFAFKRRSGRGVKVDVFQVAQGRRIVGQRLVARFAGRRKSFGWNGKANRPGRRVGDGYYFARYTARGSGGTDVRRIALRRAGGRFRVMRGFHRRATCDLLPLAKLARPVFNRARPLGVAFQVRRAARVRVTVSRRGQVVRRFAVRKRPAGRTIRLRFTSGRRGPYTVKISARRGSRRVTARLVSRRI